MLLVVDAQRGFISDSTSHALPNIRRCTQAFDTVIATQFTADTPEQFRKLLGWSGVSDGRLVPFVADGATAVIEKSRYSAAIEEVLSLLSDEPIYIVGFETDACVLATAFGLFDAGYRPIVVQDACATNAPEDTHEQALHVLRRNIGDKQVITTQNVL